MSALGVLIVLGGAVALIARHDDAASANTGGTTAADSAALRLWARFPIDASPRPVVLTGPAIIDPHSGFPMGDDKSEYVSGRIALATALPSGPASVAGQSIITANAAFALLSTPPTAGGTYPISASLKVIDIRLGTAVFSTDRGPRSLPTWTFTFAGVAGPANVLAVPAADRWPLAGMPAFAPLSDQATLSADGRHITLHFVGSPPGSGPCEANYVAHVAQSATAVSLSARALATTKPSANVACSAVGYLRTVTVTLTRALGNRVLIDPNGAPIPIG